jgi:hypothetical protein
LKLKKSTKTNKASSKNFISKKIKIKVDTIKPMNFTKKNSPTNHIQEKMIKAQDTKKKNIFFLKYKSNNI